MVTHLNHQAPQPPPLAGVRSCIPTGTARLLDAAIGEMR